MDLGQARPWMLDRDPYGTSLVITILLLGTCSGEFRATHKFVPPTLLPIPKSKLLKNSISELWGVGVSEGRKKMSQIKGARLRWG